MDHIISYMNTVTKISFENVIDDVCITGKIMTKLKK